MSLTARYHCEVFLELYRPGAKPRRRPGHSLDASAQYREHNGDLIPKLIHNNAYTLEKVELFIEHLGETFGNF